MFLSFTWIHGNVYRKDLLLSVSSLTSFLFLTWLSRINVEELNWN